MSNRVISGKYVLLRKQGDGGMAIVYKARRLDTGEIVAIKIIRPEYANDSGFIRRFKREEAAMARLSHPNIVKTYESGVDNNQFYIVMEYLEGENLKDYINRNGPLKPEMAIYIAIQVSRALQHAHANGIVHRDIKPNNILLSSNSQVKVADFGMAKVGPAGTVSYHNNNLFGSVYYISPEQVRGLQSTERSDIYSFGITLFEMMTGRVPYTGETPIAVALQHTRSGFPDPREINPDISPAMRDIIMKAAAREPYRRYSTAGELEIDLQRCLREPDGDFVVKIPIRQKAQQPPAIPQPQESEPVDGPVERNTHRPFSSRLMITVLSSLLAVILFIIIILATTGRLGGGKNTETVTVIVPNLIEKTEEEAREMLSASNLKVNVQYYNNLETNGVVISQTPEKYTRATAGDNVFIVIGDKDRIDDGGDLTKSVPNVVGMSFDEAIATLYEQGFDSSIEREDANAHIVVRQEPIAYEKAPVGTAVKLILGLSVGGDE